VTYSAAQGDAVGIWHDYVGPAVREEQREAAVRGKHLAVELPAGTEIRLDLGTRRYVNEPSCAGPY
jgi:hypothetical protein